MNLTPRLFKTYASRSINNPRLRKTYRFATHHALEKRLHVMQEVPEWEALRDPAHQIKEEAIDRLDFYLEKLETNVTANGGKVFWARDGKEASDYVLEVARRIRAKTVVKSKSVKPPQLCAPRYECLGGKLWSDHFYPICRSRRVANCADRIEIDVLAQTGWQVRRGRTTMIEIVGALGCILKPSWRARAVGRQEPSSFRPSAARAGIQAGFPPRLPIRRGDVLFGNDEPRHPGMGSRATSAQRVLRHALGNRLDLFAQKIFRCGWKPLRTAAQQRFVHSEKSAFICIHPRPFPPFFPGGPLWFRLVSIRGPCAV